MGDLLGSEGELLDIWHHTIFSSPQFKSLWMRSASKQKLIPRSCEVQPISSWRSLRCCCYYYYYRTETAPSASPAPFAQPVVHFQGLPLLRPELDSSMGRLGEIPTALDLRISVTSASEPGLYSHSAVLIYHHRPKK